MEFRGDGKEKRDYLNISDFIELSEKIINSKKNLKNQIFNVGSGIGTRMSFLLNKMKNLYGIKTKIIFSKKYNKSEHQNYVSSNLKIKKYLIGNQKNCQKKFLIILDGLKHYE